MRPRELVEKDERVRERKINRDGQATLVSSCAGTGNNRGWLEFNGRAAQYALSETTSSLLFSFFLVRFFSLLLRLLSALETAEFSSLSRLLVQHVIIKPVVAAAISCHGSLTLSSNSSLLRWPRWKSIFDHSVWDDFRKGNHFRIFRLKICFLRYFTCNEDNISIYKFFEIVSKSSYLVITYT